VQEACLNLQEQTRHGSGGGKLVFHISRSTGLPDRTVPRLPALQFRLITIDEQMLLLLTQLCLRTLIVVHRPIRASRAGDLATAPGQDVSPVFEGNSQGCLSRGRGAQL
jgi:hypothetical protein